nr:elongation factor EF-2 [Nanoarchaeota archaeon]
PFEAIKHIFEPVMTKSIEVKNPAELPKLIDVLMQVGKEDPSIIMEINQETGEYLMHGMGELHLEVIENRIQKEKGVDIKTGPPIVVYRETIRKESPESVEGKSPNKHNKIYTHVEVLEDEVSQSIREGKIREGRIKKKDKDVWEAFIEAGYDAKTARAVRCVIKGNILIDGTRGIVHIGEVMEMVMDMFEDVMKAGPIAREPCFKVKVVIDDLKLHEDAIHRGPAQMYPAIRDSIRGGMMIANPLLFEPVQTLQFEAPAEYMGEISKLISNKRGQLLDMQQEAEMITVKGKLPVGEMFGLASELRSATGGRGNFYLVDQNFEKLPENLQEKIKGQIRTRKGIALDAEVAKGK